MRFRGCHLLKTVMDVTIPCQRGVNIDLKICDAPDLAVHVCSVGKCIQICYLEKQSPVGTNYDSLHYEK